MQEEGKPRGNEALVAVEVFDYPAIAVLPLPSFEAFSSIAAPVPPAVVRKPKEATETTEAIKAARAAHAEEVRESFAAGRQRGMDEGRAAERQSLAELVSAQERRRIDEAARLVDQFDAERAGYFKAVEREVVQLALAVAARILRREAQTDPLLLSGAVRVALGQLSSSTEVRLRVPPADLDLWKDTIAHLPNLALKPTVVADEGMSLGECVLESVLGSVDLGLRSQLEEIECVLSAGSAREREQTRITPVTEEMSE